MSARKTWLHLALAVVAVLPLLLVGACAGGEEAEDGAERIDLQDPAALGAFAARVEQEPARTDELLADAGASREELHQAILAVAQDPDASREYREAFRAELGRAGEGLSADRSGS